MKSPHETIERQSKTIEEQAAAIRRLEQEAKAWKQKWWEAIQASGLKDS